MKKLLILAALALVTAASTGCTCGPLRRAWCSDFDADCNACNVCAPCGGVPAMGGCDSCAAGPVIGGGGVIGGPGVIMGPSNIPGTMPGPVIGN